MLIQGKSVFGIDASKPVFRARPSGMSLDRWCIIPRRRRTAVGIGYI